MIIAMTAKMNSVPIYISLILDSRLQSAEQLFDQGVLSPRKASAISSKTNFISKVARFVSQMKRPAFHLPGHIDSRTVSRR
jgi:hypothetical protein